MNKETERLRLTAKGQMHGVPEPLLAGLVRYIMDYCPAGDFLRAVLENDLKMSFLRADRTSWAALYSIVSFLYYEAPGPCWGSPERVRAWLSRGEQES